MELKLEHFPEFDEKFSPEAVAKMSPGRRLRVAAHFARMRQVRERYRAELRRTNAAMAAGECYCDDDHLCREHADEFHRKYAEAVRRSWRGKIDPSGL